MISETIITGFNNFSSKSNGYICSKLSVDIQLEINKFQVCAENTLRFGSSLFSATIVGSETLICVDVCDSNYFVTYGLCMLQPEFSTLLQNTTVVCEYPFVFNSVINTCECDFGFYLNFTFCVNVIQQFSIIQKNITNLKNSLQDEIQRIEIELKTSFIGLEELIINNLTALTQNMNENDKQIIDNLVNMNETVHKNIDDMKIQSGIEFKTVTDLIKTKQIQTLTYLTNINTTLKNTIDAQSAQIADNQVNIKNNFSAIMNVVATQSQVNDIYNSLISVNAIAVENQYLQLSNYIDTKFNTQTILLNNNQQFIKNNFTAQNNQITDFRTNVSSILNLVNQHITNISNDHKADLINVNTTLKNKIDIQTTLINDNQLFIKNNFTTTKDQIQSLKIAIEARFTTVDLSVQSVNTKLDNIKTQITGYQTSIQTQMNDVSTQISNTVATQSQLQDVYDKLSGVLSTKTQLTTVYDNLLAAVNEIAVTQNPCIEWPGSVNENGLCRCSYLGQTHYCSNFQSCCAYSYSTRTIHRNDDNDFDQIKYSFKCVNGITRTQSWFDDANEALSNINGICGGNQYYINE
ncbi:Hypothetical_protein [Hexamita inflata]|uniref:Hypothetical_protein n=1 Tax=Hexamita inflata TaxID=28002 RepID=A0AA86NBL9_9EUKA|nr:Hypothetical protein HINF_LOCUS3679 [Hexamita inflata]